MKPKTVDLVWLLLLAATALTWWLGAGGALVPPRLAVVALVFALAGLKGLGVMLEFMELRHAPPVWRGALIGGLGLVLALILLAYAIARPAAGAPEPSHGAGEAPRAAGTSAPPRASHP